MSLKWIEGAEGFGTTDNAVVSGLAAKYNSSADSNFKLQAGRTGGHCLEAGASVFFETPALGTISTVIVGFGFKSASYLSSGNMEVRLYDGATQHGTLQVQVTSGEWKYFRGSSTSGTQLGSTTSGASIGAGTWGYIELKVTISDSVGTVDLRVNGVSVLSLTSQDTRNGGSASIDRIRFVSSGNANDKSTWDDIYICDSSGSVNNDFLGSQKVIAVFPDGAGDSAQFTPSAGNNYAAVDENPHDGDSTFVESATSGHLDLYTYGAAAGIANIKGVQINTVCRETDANPYSLHSVCKSGSTQSNGSATSIGSTSFKTLTRVLESDPDTSAPFDLAGLNAAQFGVKLP